MQERDWSSLPDEAREQVRGLQRRYVRLWADQLCAVRPGLSLNRAQAEVHATFGLVNSTPHSSLLPEPQMRELLEEMAVRALGLQEGP